MRELPPRVQSEPVIASAPRRCDSIGSLNDQWLHAAVTQAQRGRDTRRSGADYYHRILTHPHPHWSVAAPAGLMIASVNQTKTFPAARGAVRHRHGTPV